MMHEQDNAPQPDSTVAAPTDQRPTQGPAERHRTRALWGHKVRLIDICTLEDEHMIKSTPLYEQLVRRYLLSSDDVALSTGHRFYVAYAGDTLLAICITEPRHYRVLYTIGRLYYRGRALGRALREFARSEWF